MPRYDLHIHTRESPDSRTTPEQVVAHALWHGLDGVAVTDHDTTAGVDAVRDAAPPALEVIPAAEVTTTAGHLLALDIEEAPPTDDPLRTIDRIHDQGGYAVIAHPFDPFRRNFRDARDAAAAADAIETVNARCIRHAYNHRAASFAADHDLPGVGGSDAHMHWEIGRVVTVTDRPLRDVLEDGTGVARVKGSGGHVLSHVLSHAVTSLRLLRRWRQR